MSPNRRRLLLSAVVLVGVAVCAVFLASQVDLADVGRTIAAARPLPLVGAVLTMLVVIGLAALKVQAVCAAGGLDIDAWRALRSVLTAATLNPLVPGRGGELVKAVMLAPTPDRRLDAISLVIAERIVDLTVIATGAVMAGLLSMEWRGVAAGAAVWAAVVAGLAVGAGMRRVGGKLAQATDAVARMLANPGGLLRVVGLTAATWSGNGLILALTFTAAGAEVSVLDTLVAAPVSILAGMLPVTVAGLGTREAALVLLLGDRLDEAALVASGLLYTLVTVGMAWAVGALALAAGVVVRPVPEAMAAPAGDEVTPPPPPRPPR